MKASANQKNAEINPSPSWCRYHPDKLQNCPEMQPYLEKAKTPFGTLGVKMVCEYAPYLQSGTRSQEAIHSVFQFATLMSSIPAEVLFAFVQSVIAAREKTK